MNALTTRLAKATSMALLLVAVTACDTNQGPMEEAGEKIDETATDMGNKVEDACEEAKEGMNPQENDC